MKTNETEKRGITLTVTSECNLNCLYCYENHKGSSAMNFEIAKQIIDRELGMSDNVPLTIDFIGGEPFLKFDLIKQICEYAWSKEWNHDYIFFTTTNGTLVHGEIKEWLKKNKDRFWCGLSYDGTDDMQNINRNDSSSLIDMDFFVDNWPVQGVKMTVSEKSLPYLADGVIFLHKKGFEVNCNLAYGLDWTSAEYADELQRQLSLLIDFYIENREYNPCSMLNMKIEHVANFEELGYTKWCGAGTNMRVYWIDGTRYPCHFFEPMSIGFEMAQKSLEIDFSQARDLMDLDCDGCALMPICPTCYGSNFAATGDVTKKDKNLCKLTQIQAMANSYFRYCLLNRYSNEELNITQEERKVLTDAIITIQNNFSDI